MAHYTLGLSLLMLIEASTLEVVARAAISGHRTLSPEALLTVEGAVSWLRDTAPPQEAHRSDEFLRRNSEFALKARAEVPVAQLVPEELFLNEVLPYRLLDEPVDDWRPSFFTVLAPLAKQARSLREAVEIIVPRVFTDLRKSSEVMKEPIDDPVIFRGNCTPEIMAPISETLRKGYASCTGCSILVADALRAVGIPARVVGTPAWNLPTGGNHNWVEVWTGDGWHFFDAAPIAKVDLDKAWFVPGNTKKAVKGTLHGIYAPLWDKSKADGEYTITWRDSSPQMPAEDRTEFYLHLAPDLQ